MVQVFFKIHINGALCLRLPTDPLEFEELFKIKLFHISLYYIIVKTCTMRSMYEVDCIISLDQVGLHLFDVQRHSYLLIQFVALYI